MATANNARKGKIKKPGSGRNTYTATMRPHFVPTDCPYPKPVAELYEAVNYVLFASATGAPGDNEVIVSAKAMTRLRSAQLAMQAHMASEELKAIVPAENMAKRPGGQITDAVEASTMEYTARMFARALYAPTDKPRTVEIPSDAKVTRADGELPGCWVGARVFVPDCAGGGNITLNILIYGHKVAVTWDVWPIEARWRVLIADDGIRFACTENWCQLIRSLGDQARSLVQQDLTHNRLRGDLRMLLVDTGVFGLGEVGQEMEAALGTEFAITGGWEVVPAAAAS